MAMTSAGPPLPGSLTKTLAQALPEPLLHHALQRRMYELPLMVARATYFALAPFIGADAAGKVATGVGV